MTVLMQASNQWASRPDDERFVSLNEMHNHFVDQRLRSVEPVVASRTIEARPVGNDYKGLEIITPSGHGSPTHWSFGQIAQLAGAPAGYLRKLPSPLVADCINYGMRYTREIEDVGLLVENDGDGIIRSANGPNYGRIWNESITGALKKMFGDGITGAWKVPGYFGQDVKVTKENTTLFAGDRDMFVFLCDEKNKVEVPNRRNGQPGLMSRGFFMWNSEVGAQTYGLATFFFDEVCYNRIVWGVEGFTEIRIRHTKSAPLKYLEEMQPALEAYKNGRASNVVAAIEDARSHRLDDLDEFLGNRFGRNLIQPLKLIHSAEEDRPIETRWDVVTAATAYARSIPNQDSRVALERTAGELMAA